MVNTGGSDKWLLDHFFGERCDDGLSRFEDQRLRHRHMLAAAQTIVTRSITGIPVRALRLRRDIAVVGMQNVAGNYFRRHKEQQEHRGGVKRPGQDSHSLNDATSTQSTIGSEFMRPNRFRRKEDSCQVAEKPPSLSASRQVSSDLLSILANSPLRSNGRTSSIASSD